MDAIEKLQAFGKSFEDMARNVATIKVTVPIGKLIHEPTGYSLTVYKPISRFKRIMFKWCFGLKFEMI